MNWGLSSLGRGGRTFVWNRSFSSLLARLFGDQCYRAVVGGQPRFVVFHSSGELILAGNWFLMPGDLLCGVEIH